MTLLRILDGLVPIEQPESHAARTTHATTPTGFQPQQIQLRDGKIAAVGSDAPAPAASDTGEEVARLDAGGCYVLPGFVDVHLHGGVGYDVMDGDPHAVLEIARFHAQHGVTSLLPTTMTAPPAETLRAVEAVAQAIHEAVPRREAGARILGVHLEGPFISPQFPGAQPATHIRPPDVQEFLQLVATGPVRMITLAPEQSGALELIRAAAARGIITVLGHTNATYEECQAGVALGLSQATHTYNAMRGLHHRQPGALGAVLADDRIDAQLIADNIHVHPAAMAILARCKGVDHTILITDAMRAAGLPPGEYTLGGQAVTVADGECRLADGTLAGSVLTMERALANFVAATGMTLAEAWPASSQVAARALGLAHEIGRIAPGYRADLVLLDADFAVVATIVDGVVVFLRDAERLQTN